MFIDIMSVMSNRFPSDNQGSVRSKSIRFGRMPEHAIKHLRCLFLTLRNHNMPFVVICRAATAGVGS